MIDDIQLAERIDIIIKILFIESYIKNEHYSFFKSLYLKHIKYRTGYYENQKVGGEKFISDFISLINSIRDNGYNKSYPVEINKDGKLLGGAHRISCCIFFGIKPIYTITEKKYNAWDYEWLKKNNFSLEERLLIAKKTQELFGLKMIILYGKYSLDYQKNIAIIKKDHDTYIYENLKIDNISGLISDIYSYNSIDEIDVIREKSIKLNRSNKEVSFLLLRAENFQALTKTKNIIRDNYSGRDQFEVVHSPDNIMENTHLSNIFLNYNNLKNLEIRVNNNINNSFIKNIQELDKILKIKNIKDYCIVGSAVLEVFGIHKSGDIDIIVKKEQKKTIQNTKKAIKLSDNIDIVSDNYNPKYTEEEIIKNPDLYFYFKGFKFADLSVVKTSKSKGIREKDLIHIQKIDSLINNNNYSISSEILYFKIKIKRFVLKKIIRLTKAAGIYNFLSTIWIKYILKK